jgi:hypothetical protein
MNTYKYLSCQIVGKFLLDKMRNEQSTTVLIPTKIASNDRECNFFENLQAFLN